MLFCNSQIGVRHNPDDNFCETGVVVKARYQMVQEFKFRQCHILQSQNYSKWPSCPSQEEEKNTVVYIKTTPRKTMVAHKGVRSLRQTNICHNAKDPHSLAFNPWSPVIMVVAGKSREQDVQVLRTIDNFPTKPSMGMASGEFKFPVRLRGPVGGLVQRPGMNK